MTDIILLPDVEELVVQFLLDQIDLDDFFTTGVDVNRSTVTSPPSGRVYSVLPNVKVFPAVRITRFGGQPRTFRPRHLDAAQIQIDGFAPTRKQAWEITETCASLLAARLAGVRDQGVVTGVDVGSTRPGDSAFEKIHMRLVPATIYTHPHRNIPS